MRGFDSECRFYIDPRRMEYPVYSGTPAYSVVSGIWNKPGSYALTSALTYLFTPSSSITAEVLYENTTGGTAETYLLRFLGGYTITLKYLASGSYSLSAVGGSTVTITGGAIMPQSRVGFVLTYGGSMNLYVDGVMVASGTAPALTTNPTTLEINGTANSTVSFVRVFDGLAATDAQVASQYETVANEEIFFHFNKTAFGRTRCNINTPGERCVTSYSCSRAVGYKSATASIAINNLSGKFSDDQYATYSPRYGAYNGTASQKYLKGRVGLEIETWGPNDAPLYPSNTLYPSDTQYPSGRAELFFETIFRGTTAPGSFSRSTQSGGISTLSLSAEDAIAEIARRVTRKPRKWAGYYLSRATPSSNSLFHAVAELATKREVYNYLTNSSFEAATIGDSWATTGTFARDTTAVLDGTYCGKFTGTDKEFSQTVSFEDLTVGDQLTGSIYIYSTGTLTGTLGISEKTGSTVNGTGTQAISHAGKGWQRFSVTYTLVNSSSTSAKFYLSGTGTWTNVPVDCAQLKYGIDVPYWVNNPNSGGSYSSSGVAQTGSEMLGSYDWVGIDADDVTYTHPWAILPRDVNVWDHMKQIADACACRVMVVDASGVLRFRSAFGSSPSSSLGGIQGISAIGSGSQNMRANKVNIKGSKIILRPNVECVWQAEAAALPSDAGTASGKFSRVVADGATIPSTTTDGTTELTAVYGTITDKTKVVF